MDQRLQGDLRVLIDLGLPREVGLVTLTTAFVCVFLRTRLALAPRVLSQLVFDLQQVRDRVLLPLVQLPAGYRSGSRSGSARLRRRKKSRRSVMLPHFLVMMALPGPGGGVVSNSCHAPSRVR